MYLRQKQINQLALNQIVGDLIQILLCDIFYFAVFLRITDVLIFLFGAHITYTFFIANNKYDTYSYNLIFSYLIS